MRYPLKWTIMVPFLVLTAYLGSVLRRHDTDVHGD